MNIKELNELLSRGIGEFIDPEDSFKEKLLKKQKGEYNKDIVIKFGVDPTRPDIHLGHAVVLRKLRKFQELGCKVIFLIGDFTAGIGDPTGKSKVRPEIELEEIEKNMMTYLAQVDKLLLVNSDNDKIFSWITNSDWFYAITDFISDPNRRGVKLDISNAQGEKIPLPQNNIYDKAFDYIQTRRQLTVLKQKECQNVSLRGLLWTLKHITYARLIQRDMFQDRIAKGEELYMHEMLYPVLQGIDSDVLYSIYGSCDLEVGGTDQTFNMLMGRDVMKANKKEPQAVLSFQLLEGLDGKEKMSKSLNNYIAINDNPQDIYGKVMSLPDNLIIRYFELTTDIALDEIRNFEKELNNGANPRDYKMKLAFELVKFYHSEKLANEAQEYFISTFSKKEIPDDMLEICPSEYNIIAVLVEANMVKSKSEARKVIEQHGVKINGEVVGSISASVDAGDVVQKGSRFFVKVV